MTDEQKNVLANPDSEHLTEEQLQDAVWILEQLRAA
jgi:hypothetical protein